MATFLIRIMLIVIAVLAGLSACSGNETEPDGTIAYEEPRFDRNEVICKRQRPVGSHVPVRVCKTRAQMEMDREAAYRNYGPGAPETGDLPPPPPSPTPP